MIASKLPPSRVLGSVATTIHARKFRCFVSTARRFFISLQWEVAVFAGDPGVDEVIRLLAQARYSKRLPKEEIYRAHDAIADHIDARGDSSSLHHEVTSVFEDFASIGVLKNVRIKQYGMVDHLGG